MKGIWSNSIELPDGLGDASSITLLVLYLLSPFVNRHIQKKKIINFIHEQRERICNSGKFGDPLRSEYSSFCETLDSLLKNSNHVPYEKINSVRLALNNSRAATPKSGWYDDLNSVKYLCNGFQHFENVEWLNMCVFEFDKDSNLVATPNKHGHYEIKPTLKFLKRWGDVDERRYLSCVSTYISGKGIATISDYSKYKRGHPYAYIKYIGVLVDSNYSQYVNFSIHIIDSMHSKSLCETVEDMKNAIASIEDSHIDYIEKDVDINVCKIRFKIGVHECDKMCNRFAGSDPYR